MDKTINPNALILAPGYRGRVSRESPALKTGLLKDYNFIPIKIENGKAFVLLEGGIKSEEYSFTYTVDLLRPLSTRTPSTTRSITLGIRRSAIPTTLDDKTLFARSFDYLLNSAYRNTTDYLVYKRPGSNAVSGKVDFVFRDLLNPVQSNNLEEYRLPMDDGTAPFGQVRPVWDIVGRKIQGSTTPISGDILFRGMGILGRNKSFNYSLDHICFKGGINPVTNSAQVAKEELVSGNGWSQLAKTSLLSKNRLFGYTHLVTTPHHNTLLFRMKNKEDYDGIVVPPPTHFQHFLDSTPDKIISNVTTNLPPPISGEHCLMTYDEKRDRHYRLEMNGNKASLAIINKDGNIARIPILSSSTAVSELPIPQLFMFDEDWLYVDKGYVRGEDKPYLLHMDSFEIDFNVANLSFYPKIQSGGRCSHCLNTDAGDLYCFVAGAGQGGVYVLDRAGRKWDKKFSDSFINCEKTTSFYIGNGEFLTHMLFKEGVTPRIRITKYRSGPNNLSIYPNPFGSDTVEALPLYHPELGERGLIYISKETSTSQTLVLSYLDPDTVTLTTRGLVTTPDIVRYTSIQWGFPYWSGAMSSRYQLGAFFFHGAPEGNREIRDYRFQIDTRFLMDLSSTNIQSNFQLVDPLKLDYNDFGGATYSRKNLYRPKDGVDHTGVSYSGLLTTAPTTPTGGGEEVRYILTPNGIPSLRLFFEKSGNNAMIKLPPLVEFGSTILFREGRIRILGWNGSGYSLWESTPCVSPDTMEFDADPGWEEIVPDSAGIEWVRGSPPVMVEVDGKIVVIYLYKNQGNDRLNFMFLDPGVYSFRFGTVSGIPAINYQYLGAALVVNTEGKNMVFFTIATSSSSSILKLDPTDVNWTNMAITSKLSFYNNNVSRILGTLTKNDHYGLILLGGSRDIWESDTIPLLESTEQSSKRLNVQMEPKYDTLKNQLGFTCGTGMALSTNTEWLWATPASDPDDPAIVTMQIKDRPRVRDVPSGLSVEVVPWNNKLLGQPDTDGGRYYDVYDPITDQFTFHPAPSERNLRDSIQRVGDEVVISTGFIAENNNWPVYRIDKEDHSFKRIEIDRYNHSYTSIGYIYGSDYYWKQSNLKVSSINLGGSDGSLGYLIEDSVDKYRYQAYEGAVQSVGPIRYNGNDLYLSNKDLYPHTGMVYTRPSSWFTSGDQNQGTIRYFDSNTGKGYDIIITQRAEGSRLNLIDTDPMRSGTTYAPSVKVREKLYPGIAIYYGFTCSFKTEVPKDNALYLVTEQGLYLEGSSGIEVAAPTTALTPIPGPDGLPWPGFGTAVGDGFVYCISKFTSNSDDIYLWVFDGSVITRVKLTVNIESRYEAPQTFGPQDYAGYVQNNVLYAWVDNHMYAIDLINLTISGYI